MVVPLLGSPRQGECCCWRGPCALLRKLSQETGTAAGSESCGETHPEMAERCVMGMGEETEFRVILGGT